MAAGRPRTGPAKAGRRPLDVLGRTGLVEQAGFIVDEWDINLQGVRGRRAYREMADQDATVGAILFAVEMLCRQVNWDVSPADDSPEAAANARFVEEALGDMEESWPDTLAEILTMLVYGWSYHEILYKVRDGLDTADPTRRSAYTDRKIGWRAWAIRSQESLLRWDFDEQGGLRGLWQQPAPDYQLRYIPYEVALLFRPTARRGNPEGRSILRAAYKSYYAKKAIEAIEGIGIERDLAGFPLLHAPSTICNPASADEIAASDAYLQMLTRVRVDEQMGAMLPSERDEHGNLLYEFKLIASAGQGKHDTNTVISRYATQIAQSVLADFLQLGHSSRGTQALGASKMEMFNTAIGAILDALVAVANARAVPALLRLNGIRDKFPTIEHGDIERADIMQFGQFLFNLAQAGAELDLSAGSPLLGFVLEEAGLPLGDGDTETPTVRRPRRLTVKAPRTKPAPPQQADGANTAAGAPVRKGRGRTPGQQPPDAGAAPDQ